MFDNSKFLPSTAPAWRIEVESPQRGGTTNEDL